MSVQEQELYQKEGLGVNEVHYVDNQDCIGECPCQLPSKLTVDPQTSFLTVCTVMSQKFTVFLQNVTVENETKIFQHCMQQNKHKRHDAGLELVSNVKNQRYRSVCVLISTCICTLGDPRK